MTYGRYKFSLAPAGTRVYPAPPPERQSEISPRVIHFSALFIYLQRFFFIPPAGPVYDYYTTGPVCTPSIPVCGCAPGFYLIKNRRRPRRITHVGRYNIWETANIYIPSMVPISARILVWYCNIGHRPWWHYDIVLYYYHCCDGRVRYIFRWTLGETYAPSEFGGLDDCRSNVVSIQCAVESW